MQGEPMMAHTLTVPADHPAFAGHFPGAPILPGVVLLDAVVQRAPGASAGVRQIASAKFLSPVAPGEHVVISFSRTAGAGLRFDLRHCSAEICDGTYFDGDRLYSINMNGTTLPQSLQPQPYLRGLRLIASLGFPGYSLLFLIQGIKLESIVVVNVLFSYDSGFFINRGC